MKVHRVAAIIRRQAYETYRNFDRLIDIVYWPVISLVVWGFLSLYVSQNTYPGSGVVSFILGAVILWGLFYSFQRDMAMGFLDELWARNLLNLFVTPLSIWEYVLGLTIVNTVKVTIAFAASSSIAFIFYHFNIFSLSLQFVPFLLPLLIFGLALGFFITAIILRYTTKIQTLAWSLAGLIEPVSCVYYPLATLPHSLQVVAWLLPTTHIFEGMRRILTGGEFPWQHWWWGVWLSVGYFGLAVLFFAWIFEVTKRRGLLVRLD